MTGAQLRSIQIALMEYGPVEVHLAGRRGADEQVFEIADRLRLWRMVHPGITPHPGDCPACHGDIRFPAKSEDQRFSDIAVASGVLLAAPSDAHPAPGCRTWWTVHHARELGRPVVLVLPDGSMTRWEVTSRNR